MRILEKGALYILFLSVIIFPFSYYEIKIPILFWFLVKAFFKTFRRQKIDITPTVFVIFFIYIFSSLFFIVYGLLLNQSHPESLPFIFALYIAFPIIYLILLTGIPKKSEIIQETEQILFFGLLGVSIVLILAYFNKKYGLPSYFNFILESINVDLRTTKDVVKINYHGISSVLFLFPFFFTRFILKKNKKRKEIVWNILVIIIAFVGVFLTGRRAVIILFLFSIIVAFFIKLQFFEKIKIKGKTLNFIAALFILSIPFLAKINYDKLTTSISSTIIYAINLNDASSTGSDSERVKQIKSFLKYIGEKPILGRGHGAYMKEIIRSKDKPWRYEVSYLDIIFHTGFVGFILYSIGPIWIFISLMRIGKFSMNYRPSSMGMVNALVCTLIAYGTNPYLNALDIQWVIYYPILFIMIVNKKRSNV